MQAGSPAAEGDFDLLVRQSCRFAGRYQLRPASENAATRSQIRGDVSALAVRTRAGYLASAIQSPVAAKSEQKGHSEISQGVPPDSQALPCAQFPVEGRVLKRLPAHNRYC